ncbi:hypothetical protein NE237_005391 [Protea cynaroides]|uniref:Uncharacterized protein n=1 Tax=Protea cynaroides TaxID=273540 RepID=A0A9Q0KKI6_9MAGN|nr:hypothetical protein NE237_005391 [Protea cynaroides]
MMERNEVVDKEASSTPQTSPRKEKKEEKTWIKEEQYKGKAIEEHARSNLIEMSSSLDHSILVYPTRDSVTVNQVCDVPSITLVVDHASAPLPMAKFPLDLCVPSIQEEDPIYVENCWNNSCMKLRNGKKIGISPEDSLFGTQLESPDGYKEYWQH